MKTVCVTGHRPAKLPWGYKKEGPDYDEYIESLACTIADYLENGYDHFITGMALGVDMDFAETVIQFREHYDLDVKLECAIPCPNQTLKWSPAETDRYKQILEKADKVTLVNDHYFRAFGMVSNLAGLGTQFSMPKQKGKRSISLISAVNIQLSLSDSVIFSGASPKNAKNHFFITKNQTFSQVIILIYRSDVKNSQIDSVARHLAMGY